MSKEIKVKKIITSTKEVGLQIDGATLLSIEEYKKAKEHIKPVGRAWWLRSPGYYVGFAALVNYDGYLYYDGFDVDDHDTAVRPALRINLESSDFQIGDAFHFGGYTWAVICDGYALCDTTICKMPFRKAWHAPNAHDYEKSDVKKFLDDWYAEQ